MEKIDSQISDWRVYDKWRDTVENNQIKFYYESDGYVDMIYKIHKNYGGPLWDKRGYAHLTRNQNDYSEVLVDSLDSVKVGNGFRGKGSGVTISYTARKFLNMMSIQHEHGHCLYADGHIIYGKVSQGPGGDGFFSPYEMVLLKYQSMDTVNYNSMVNYYLADYSSRNTSNGEILRVPISGNECFLLANRGNASTWDKPMLGDTVQINGPYEFGGNYSKGVYIYHVNQLGIIYPHSGAIILSQDEECADGIWHWSNKGSAQRYAWDAGYCYNASSWDYYMRDSVSYDNDGGWNYSPADGRSHTYPIWAGIGKINETEACLMGTDRIYTNSTEIYSNEEVLGDRYDPWKTGYNEVFSPYSSPSTKTMSNNNSGIYIWLYSSSGSGPTTSAAFNIFKAGEGGYTDSSILAVTPPSRPMGLKVLPCESQPVINNLKRIKISWNHNMEPDMRRTITGETDKFKRYKIYRSTAEDMSHVPSDALQYPETVYDYIATVDLNENSAPYFIDSGLVSTCNDALCGATSCWEMYPVRYRVQAVDVYNDVSVLSDFVNTEAWDTGTGEGSYEGENFSNSSISSTELPKEYSLKQNYPNPFNPSTNIQYDLPTDNFVSIKIYNVLGKEITTLINENKTAGRYIVSFNASKYPSGIYYYKIKAGNYEAIRKMMLIK